MSTYLFSYVKALVSPVDYSTTVEWKLVKGYKPVSATLNFYVEVARAGGDFTRLNPSAPVVNDFHYTDSIRYQYNIQNDIVYRVVMEDNGTSYASIPVQIGGPLSSQERNLVREISRRKYVQLVKRTGVRGYLLRARDWGTDCPNNDPDSETPFTGECPLCYGGGILGGFFPAIEYWLEPAEKAGIERKTDGTTGTEMTHISKWRCINYPAVFPDDLWVDAQTGDRYTVAPEYIPEVYIRSYPIMGIIAMTKLPPTSYLYNVPVGSGAATGTDGWTSGLATIAARGQEQLTEPREVLF